MSQWEILATDDPNKTLGQRHIEAVRKYFLDKGEKPRTCSVEGCYREVLVIKNPDGETVEFDKCIFHVDKENEYWYKEKTDKINIYNTTILDWNDTLVHQFWELIREFKNVKSDKLKDMDDYTKWGILERNFMGNLDKIYRFSSFVFPNFETFVSYTYAENNFKINIAFVKPYKIETHTQGNFIARAKKNFSFWNSDEPLVFDYNVEFSGAKFIDKAYFPYINFKEKAFFNKVRFLQGSDFSNSVFQDDIHLNDALFLYAFFNNVKFHKSVNINKSYFENILSFYGAYFSNHSSLSAKNIVSRNMSFKNARIEGLIQLSSITTCEIDLENTVIISSGKIVISINKNCTNSEMTLKFPPSSDGIIITDSDLRTFKLLHFGGNIEDVRFINVNWGEVSKERFCPDITDYRKKRDIFRQIKLALDKQENYIDARKFYALEMWAYGEELKSLLQENQEENSITWKDKLNLYTDITVYKFYEWTSNFGLSWIKPLFLLITLSILFGSKELIRTIIYPYYKMLAEMNFQSFLYGQSLILELISRPLNWIAEQIISIIPGIASMQKEIEGFEFITLLYYSFSAYLIYQFVMAIRRKVRR